MKNASNGPEAKDKKNYTKYMVFVVGDERFAMPLSEVKEVIGLTALTAVPNVPKYFRGLINLRGNVVSILDLREKLNIKGTVSETPCIIISEFRDITVGTIVDDVVEVAMVDESQIKNNLDISNHATREQILGAICADNKPMTLILDMAKTIDLDVLLALRINGKESAKKAA